MKPTMPNIIHKAQGAFIGGRLISDNNMLATEILSKFNTRSHQYFCAKIDLEKAFDSICRSALLHRMKVKGFSDSFISWVSHCINNVNYSIIINGHMSGFLTSTSGLRQGCPLSPYLFAIVMDILSCMLEEVSHILCPPMNGNISISHLLYADDILIFGKATPEAISCMQDVLLSFHEATGLKANPTKSSIMFSATTCNAEALAALSGFKLQPLPMKYLGLPLSTKKLKMTDFSPLLDNLQARLSGWKVSSLSFAGRLQFLKASIWNYLDYWFRSAIIPKNIIKKITSIAFRFLLNNGSSSKIHCISWDKTASPKSKGGLGLCSIPILYNTAKINTALRTLKTKSLLNSWWLEYKDSIWKAKQNSQASTSTQPKATPLWESINLAALSIKNHITLGVGNSSSWSFIKDPWLHSTCILDHMSVAQIASLGIGLNEQCCKFIINNSWNLQKLNQFPHIQSLISDIPILNSDSLLCWNSKHMSSATIKSSLYSHKPTVYWWKWIWFKGYKLRFTTYIWLAINEGLKTKDNLIKRGVPCPSSCVFCNVSEESHKHLFFQCNFTFQVLHNFIPETCFFLLGPSILQLLQHSDSLQGNAKKNYLLKCSFLTYHVWLERNRRIFHNKNLNADALTCFIFNQFNIMS